LGWTHGDVDGNNGPSEMLFSILAASKTAAAGAGRGLTLWRSNLLSHATDTTAPNIKAKTGDRGGYPVSSSSRLYVRACEFFCAPMPKPKDSCWCEVAPEDPEG